MKRNAVLSLALAAALCLTGCGGPTPAVPDRPASAAPVSGEIRAFSSPLDAAGRLLALETAQHPGENVILSPLSLELALCMAANGAAGEARTALEALLGGDTDTWNAAAKASLAERDDTLFLANSMWFNEGLKEEVSPSFRAVLSDVYGAEEAFFRPGDAGALNRWVSRATRKRIAAILTDDALTEDTLAVLVNALYFNGEWTAPFEHGQNVREGTFSGTGGSEDAEFLVGEEHIYFETDRASAFAKPYKNGYEFVGILPKAGGVPDLTCLDLDALLDSRTGEYDVSIGIPKFELTYAASLKETLAGLGLGSLFADGSMNAALREGSAYTAWVDDVIQKTYLRMYEKGTEGAAATAVVNKCGSAAPREPKEVFLDRPFAFLILGGEQVVFAGTINTLK